MKFLQLATQVAGIASLTLFLTGCETAGTSSNAGTSTGPHTTTRYVSTDHRVIDTGRPSNGNGGREFKNPHLDKCWIADGFDFNGFDTLYIAPTTSTAHFQADEQAPHELAKENLVKELAASFQDRSIFKNVVTNTADIKPGAHVLKMENTITEYAKGGGGARYWAGLYGAGQPNLRVSGKMSDGDKTVFTYEGRRSGVSAGARMFGAMKTDVDIQHEDIKSLTLDLSDFASAVAGKYQAKN
jgi:hypothetical protein